LSVAHIGASASPRSPIDDPMSLIVLAQKRLPDGSTEDLIPTPPHNDLAGFESTRLSFYGSERARNLGLVLLPVLAHQDIHASGADLAILERETRLLLDNLDVATDHAYWSFRLNNILEAIRLAKSVTNGVGVVYIG
jgi:hypothetical protein